MNRITQTAFTELETDPKRIIQPVDICNSEICYLYFLQRCGDSIIEHGQIFLPVMFFEPRIFKDMLDGEYPIFTQLYNEYPSVFRQFIFLNLSPQQANGIGMTLPMEAPDVGDELLQFLANINHPQKDIIFDTATKVTRMIQSLYANWSKNGKPYYKLTDLPDDFCSASALDIEEMIVTASTPYEE